MEVVVVQGKNKKVQMLDEISARNQLIQLPVDASIVPIAVVGHQVYFQRDKHTPVDTLFSLG